MQSLSLARLSKRTVQTGLAAITVRAIASRPLLEPTRPRVRLVRLTCSTTTKIFKCATCLSGFFHDVAGMTTSSLGRFLEWGKHILRSDNCDSCASGLQVHTRGLITECAACKTDEQPRLNLQDGWKKKGLTWCDSLRWTGQKTICRNSTGPSPGGPRRPPGFHKMSRELQMCVLWRVGRGKKSAKFWPPAFGLHPSAPHPLVPHPLPRHPSTFLGPPHSAPNPDRPHPALLCLFSPTSLGPFFF